MSRVKHLIQVDTSQLDRWEEVVQRPVENVVEHLLDGTLPDVKVNHAFWEQQSASFGAEEGWEVGGTKSSSAMCAKKWSLERSSGTNIWRGEFIRGISRDWSGRSKQKSILRRKEGRKVKNSLYLTSLLHFTSPMDYIKDKVKNLVRGGRNGWKLERTDIRDVYTNWGEVRRVWPPIESTQRNTRGIHGSSSITLLFRISECL